jgi:fermentation-respiration switch protein FrsA (DUF1100 family)
MALYRLSEAARLLSVSGPTLKQWIYKGPYPLGADLWWPPPNSS